jgi:flagellar biogenesis protein FliO
VRRVRVIVIGALALAPVAARAQNAAQPHLGGGGGSLDISLGRIIASLVICLMIAVLAILLIRQRGGRGDLAAIFSRLQPQARAIEVVETRRLSPHADICLVRHDGRDYLLVLQQGSMQLLRDAPTTDGKAPCA